MSQNDEGDLAVVKAGPADPHGEGERRSRQGGPRGGRPAPERPRSERQQCRQERDEAYHQGTVWQWLIGPYIDVHLRIHNDRKALQLLLQPMIDQLWKACLGMISEVAEPEPPFTPAGCFAQAWSIAEILRCWLLAAE